MTYGISKQGFSRLENEFSDYIPEHEPVQCPDCGSTNLEDNSSDYEYGSKRWTEYEALCQDCGRAFSAKPKHRRGF